MNSAPASIKVICILGIIFASAAILITPLSLILVFHPLTPNPVAAQLLQDRGYVTFTVAGSGLNILFATLLLISSIASLRLKPWGRKAMLFYAWARVADVSLVSIVNIVFILPKLETAMTSTPALATSPVAGIFRIATTIGLVVGILFALAISGVLIYFFNRKIAKDAFNGIFPPPASAFPMETDGPAA